jgi:hypothetical protein
MVSLLVSVWGFSKQIFLLVPYGATPVPGFGARFHPYDFYDFYWRTFLQARGIAANLTGKETFSASGAYAPRQGVTNFGTRMTKEYGAQGEP